MDDGGYSSYLNYNGHGMIERYPRDMSLLYTTSHERRHVVSNKLDAIAKGEEVSQDVSYKVSISKDSRIIVEGGTTKSVTKKKGSSADFSEAEKNIKTHVELTRTSLKIDSLSADYMEAKGSAKGVLDGNNISLKLDKRESKKIKSELLRLESIVKDLRGELAASSVTTVMPQGETVKSDHISLRLDSQEVASLFKYAERRAPGVLLNDGVGSALRVSNTLNRLNEKSQINIPFINFRFKKSVTYQDMISDAFDRFDNKLANLDEGVSAISNRDSFNIHEGDSTDPDSLTVTPSFGSNAGDYRVNVSSLAQGERIVSDEISDPFASLGLSGSFKVNGYTVSVESSDNLYNIRDKINYGEDSNRNGGLDYAEDINGNGAIDSVYIKGVMTSAGYVDAFFLYEDINSNGVLDGSEDINGNSRLDGGTENIGVSASVERNRIVLDSVGAYAIHLSDTEGILADLGFYAQNRFGSYSKRESVLLPDGTDLNRAASKARLEVDGKDYNRSQNYIDDLIPEAIIEIKKLPSATVDISIRNNYARPIKEIETFVDSYNELIAHLNDDALSNGFLNIDSGTQRMRGNLVKGVTETSVEAALSPSGIGLNIVGGKRMVSQTSLMNLERLSENKGNFLSFPTSGEGTLLGGLKKIGITNRMNDTLTIDYDRLSSAIKRELSDVVETLSGVNGVSARIKEETAKALYSVGGELTFQAEFDQGLAESIGKSLKLSSEQELLGSLLDNFA